MRKIGWQFLLLCSVLAIVKPTLAACSFTGGGAGNAIIDLPSTPISIPDDTANGTVLWSTGWKWFTTGQINCTTNGKIMGILSSEISTPSPIPRVRATNVPGIGVAIFWCNKNVTSCPTDPWGSGAVGGGVSSGWSELSALDWQFTAGKYDPFTQVWVYLIKTGKIEPGVLSIAGSSLAQYDGLATSRITFAGTTNVSSRSCVQTSPSAIRLELPTIAKNEFGKTGTPLLAGKERAFDITLACDPSLNVKLSIASNGSPVQNVLANSIGGNMATGVGIQLFQGGVASQTVVPLDVKRDITTTASSGNNQPVTIPLTARYYKFGDIVPGQVRVSTTYTLTYE